MNNTTIQTQKTSVESIPMQTAVPPVQGQNAGPEKKFKAGAVSASIWENTGMSQNGQPVTYKTISLQRAYKDKNGEWQHSTSMRLSDLPKAAVVLQKAYEYLVLHDVDHGDLIASSSA